MKRNKKLKIALIKANLSQKKFADLINRPENFVSLIVNGRVNPTFDEKKVMADTLNLKIEDIF
jgi:DNA-binding XRE family transcriptional regulator